MNRLFFGDLLKMNNNLFLKTVKKQIKFNDIGDNEIEDPIKTYLAQPLFADKRNKQ